MEEENILENIQTRVAETKEQLTHLAIQSVSCISHRRTKILTVHNPKINASLGKLRWMRGPLDIMLHS